MLDAYPDSAVDMEVRSQNDGGGVVPPPSRRDGRQGDGIGVQMLALHRVRFQFLADDAAQRVLELRRPSVEVLAQGRVDQGLIAGCAAGLFRHFEKTIHDLPIQPDRDTGFALGFGFRR